MDEFVEEHLPAMLRFATRLCGDPAAAEDIVQEALVRVVRSWKSFRRESEVRTWLFRIVLNVYRSHRPRRPAAIGLSPELHDPHAADPAGAALDNELAGLIAARIAALPPRQREVIVLVACEGCTPREAAEALQITEANVYATLHVARRRLREELQPYLTETTNE